MNHDGVGGSHGGQSFHIEGAMGDGIRWSYKSLGLSVDYSLQGDVLKFLVDRRSIAYFGLGGEVEIDMSKCDQCYTSLVIGDSDSENIERVIHDEPYLIYIWVTITG
jgi:hypothetical protein